MAMGRELVSWFLCCRMWMGTGGERARGRCMQYLLAVLLTWFIDDLIPSANEVDRQENKQTKALFNRYQKQAGRIAELL